ncbi:hypothetical protein HB825_01570 [Listeria booriae]|uniref:hypothetical protein n=1 Tax=Listeria booriae TaxID=1552123 RepID=UPI00164D3B78|nr:hypothetical protein [Listeria booriae]MBC6133524.1 hypothetical protein [Listeria booriae]
MVKQLENFQVKAYSLRTPVYSENDSIENVYINDFMETFLRRLLAMNAEERRMINEAEKKYIELVNIFESEDKDFIQGEFNTATFGTTQEIKDLLTGEKIGVKGVNDGVISIVYFQINKKNGLLLVEKDEAHVFSKNIFMQYFNNKKHIVSDFYSIFNKANESISLSLLDSNRCLFLDVIQPKEFKEEIKAFASVKEVFIEFPLTEDKSDIIGQLETLAKDNGLKGVNEIKVAYRNTVRKGSVRHIESFFDKVIEDANMSPGISGRLNSGRTKTIRKIASRLTQDFDIKVKVNGMGVKSFSDMFSEMIAISKTENLLPKINSNAITKLNINKVGVLIEEGEQEAG